MTPPPRPYRTACPLCEEMTGVPWSVVTAGGGRVTIHLRCGCGHEWSATRVTDQSAPYGERRGSNRGDVIELGAKPERRSAT